MSNETNSQDIVSNEANSQATPHISDQPVSQPINLVSSSSEQEPTENPSSQGENNSGANQGTPSRNTESVSWNLLLHERQPSPTGPLPEPMAEAPRAPSVDPYLQAMLDQPVPAHYNLSNPNGAGTSRAAAGPSNIRDHFSWGSMMEREFGIENPEMRARTPVERLSIGMSMDEFRQMQALTDSLIHTRERVTAQAEALEGAYFHAEVAEMIAKGARDAIERVMWILMALIVLVLALMVKLFLYM
jgi:hypothetical protein